MSVPKPARYRVGRVDLLVVSDGTWTADAGALMGIIPRMMWEPLLGPPDAQNRMQVGLNCLLVRTPERTILVDTGMGTKLSGALRELVFPGDYGYLPESLAAAGVDPGSVDVVVNSHLHADHCGWNTVRRDEQLVPYFPRARYYAHRLEIASAGTPSERTRAAYAPENFQPLVEQGRLEPMEGEVRLTDEVTIIQTPGHTEGHCSVVVSSGGETAIYLGDMMQHEVQLERLPWISAFDVLPLVSLETKRVVVQRAVRDNALLVCVHAPFPGVGRLKATEGGRAHWHTEPSPGDTA